MRKTNDIMGLLAVAVCSAAAAVTLLTGNYFFTAVNVFFAALNGLTIYSRLAAYRETLDDEGEEASGF